jgi:hypothetical protein
MVQEERRASPQGDMVGTPCHYPVPAHSACDFSSYIKERCDRQAEWLVSGDPLGSRGATVACGPKFGSRRRCCVSIQQSADCVFEWAFRAPASTARWAAGTRHFSACDTCRARGRQSKSTCSYSSRPSRPGSDASSGTTSRHGCAHCGVRLPGHPLRTPSWQAAAQTCRYRSRRQRSTGCSRIRLYRRRVPGAAADFSRARAPGSEAHRRRGRRHLHL